MAGNKDNKGVNKEEGKTMTLKELNDKKYEAEDKFWNHLDGRRVDPTVTEELEGAMIDASEAFDKAFEERIKDLLEKGVQEGSFSRYFTPNGAHNRAMEETLGISLGG